MQITYYCLYCYNFYFFARGEYCPVGPNHREKIESEKPMTRTDRTNYRTNDL